MFTVNVQVKQVGPDRPDGTKSHYDLLSESLYLAESVVFVNEGDQRWVALNFKNGESTTFHHIDQKDQWYDIFVMNEQGQTVARYHP
jgi:hypothetical protein